MKTFALIASFIALVAMVSADPQHERGDTMKKIHDECQADPATKIDHGVMEKFAKGEPVDEAKFSKHLLCMNVKSKVQKENGDVDKDVLKQLFVANEKADEIVADCGEKKGTTAEEAALALFKCFMKYIPEHQHHHH